MIRLKRRQSNKLSSQWLARKHIHAVHAELARRFLLGCRTKTIEPGGNVYVLETNMLQIANELCLRQSAGDSTGPQVDVAADILGQLDIKRDVPEIQPTARFEYPNDLGEPEFLLGHEIEHTVRDDHVNARVRNR